VTVGAGGRAENPVAAHQRRLQRLTAKRRGARFNPDHDGGAANLVGLLVLMIFVVAMMLFGTIQRSLFAVTSGVAHQFIAAVGLFFDDARHCGLSWP
jgi:hypothetical protein